MHPRLAAVYMAALAEDIAGVNKFTPATEETIDHVAALGWGWTDSPRRCWAVVRYWAKSEPRVKVRATKMTAHRLIRKFPRR